MIEKFACPELAITTHTLSHSCKGCVSFFCAACLLEHARREGMSPPAILGLCAPSLLGCRRRRRGRWRGLLPCGLVLKKTLLFARLTLELLLVLTQAVLLLPELRPATIQQRQTQRKHRIHMLGSPMHAWPFQTGLHHELVTAFHTARPDRPALLLVSRIVHQLTPLLQVVHLLLDLGIAPG